MNEMQVAEALLRAILELIEKCETLEELRASVKRIMGKQKSERPPRKERRSQHPERRAGSLTPAALIITE